MQYSPTVFTVTLGVGLVCDSTRVDGGWVGERLGGWVIGGMETRCSKGCTHLPGMLNVSEDPWLN